ncbi:hypothetical protein DL93DRAFT_2224928, partial [Clavulina sp. PMI_390]
MAIPGAWPGSEEQYFDISPSIQSIIPTPAAITNRAEEHHGSPALVIPVVAAGDPMVPSASIVPETQGQRARSIIPVSDINMLALTLRRTLYATEPRTLFAVPPHEDNMVEEQESISLPQPEPASLPLEPSNNVRTHPQDPPPGGKRADSQSQHIESQILPDNTSTSETREPVGEDDVLPRFRNMYRLLELYSEQGSSGLTEKVLISQDSVCDLIEKLRPGASAGITSINFHMLDNLLLKPLGMYGSKVALIDHLVKLEAIDDSTEHLLRTNETCLKSGIYIIPSLPISVSDPVNSLVIFWPEPTTWDDDCAPSVERNRVTFMRYLTKLTDQIIALISKEHSDAMTWGVSTVLDDNDQSEDPMQDSRLYTFEVLQTMEQEESVTLHPGFELPLPERILQSGADKITAEKDCQPRLVPGETRQGILKGDWHSEVMEPILKKSLLTATALRALFKDLSKRIVLGADLSHDGLEILAANGLAPRFPGPIAEWKLGLSGANADYQQELKTGTEGIQAEIRAEMSSLKKAIYSHYFAQAQLDHPALEDEIQPLQQIMSTIDASVAVEVPSQFLQPINMLNVTQPALGSLDPCGSMRNTVRALRYRRNVIIQNV